MTFIRIPIRPGFLEGDKGVRGPTLAGFCGVREVQRTLNGASRSLLDVRDEIFEPGEPAN